MVGARSMPSDYFDGFYQKKAAERVDPHEDLVGFFTALGDVIEEYKPQVEAWVAEHGFKSAGEVLDLLASVRVEQFVPEWAPSLRQLWLHNLPTDVMARMLGVDETLITEYIAVKYQSPSNAVKTLHAKGLTNEQISQETGLARNTVRQRLAEMGLRRNGTARVTPTQRRLIIDLRGAGKTYAEIQTLAVVNLDQVKNTLRAHRLEIKSA